MTLDSAEFRRILGHYPTGVCAITSTANGMPVGMIVGSFTSVSLDPPLVAFFPGKDSTTWPKILASGRFCVNVLADHQHEVCRTLLSKSEAKFLSVSHRASNAGLPILDDIVAWIDCDIRDVHEAGDHYIAVGEVHSLAIETEHHPLLFFRGQYGEYSSSLNQS